MKKSDKKDSILRVNKCTYLFIKRIAECTRHSMSFVVNQFMIYFKRLCDKYPERYEKYHNGQENGLILKEGYNFYFTDSFVKVTFHFKTNQFLYNCFKKLSVKYYISISKLVDFIVCEVGLARSYGDFVSYLRKLDEKSFNDRKRNLANFNLKKKKI